MYGRFLKIFLVLKIIVFLLHFRACYGVLRFIMENGAKGCEVVVSGKLRGQRAKSMKFVDGLMIHSGDPCNDYVDTATRHVLLRQGMLQNQSWQYNLVLQIKDCLQKLYYGRYLPLLF